MTTKDLTKELYFGKNDATTIAEVKELFDHLFRLTWTISIFGRPAQTINLSELGWRIDYNNRKKAAGICRRSWKIDHNGKKTYNNKRVELSMHFIKQNLEEGKGAEWEEVIRHELAHAVDFEIRGESNHDHHWKAVANEMLSTGRVTFKIGSDLKDEKPSKYTLICDNCGKEKPSHREKKRKTACGDCCRKYNGGKYSTDFIYRQVKNY